jgi:hypothetical protein
MMEPKSRGVLDTPHARGMTILCGATLYGEMGRFGAEPAIGRAFARPDDSSQ